MSTIDFLFNKIYSAESLIRNVNMQTFLGNKLALVNGFPHSPTFENIIRLVSLSEDCAVRVLVYPFDFVEGDPVPGFALTLAALYPVDGIALISEAEWDDVIAMLSPKCKMIDFESNDQS